MSCPCRENRENSKYTVTYPDARAPKRYASGVAAAAEQRRNPGSTLTPPSTPS